MYSFDSKLIYMKIKFAILFVFLITGARCQSKSDFKRLSWLEGTWTSTNSKPGQTGYENWKLTVLGELGGVGVTMKGNDTVFVEKFKIASRDGDLFYVADVPENKSPVYFKLTEITDNGFTCENPEHDFPKKIAYVKDGDKLKATISGDGKSRDFLFIRKN
jgi:hypothetical protein